MVIIPYFTARMAAGGQHVKECLRQTKQTHVTSPTRLVAQQGPLFGVALGAIDLARTLIEGQNGLIASAPGSCR
jgi:hypothetical protein